MGVLTETFPVARKQHQCWWCRTDIEVGEKHYKQVNTYDGRLQSIRMHKDCDGAWRRWWKVVNPDGYEESLDPWEDDGKPVRGGWVGPEDV